MSRLTNLSIVIYIACASLIVLNIGLVISHFRQPQSAPVVDPDFRSTRISTSLEPVRKRTDSPFAADRSSVPRYRSDDDGRIEQMQTLVAKQADEFRELQLKYQVLAIHYGIDDGQTSVLPPIDMLPLDASLIFPNLRLEQPTGEAEGSEEESANLRLREHIVKLDSELDLALQVNEVLQVELTQMRRQLEQIPMPGSEADMDDMDDDSMDDVNYEITLAVEKSLVARGAAAVPVLIALLDHEEPGVREWATETLGLLGTLAAPAESALIDLTEDPDQFVQAAARRVLTIIDTSK